MWPWVTGFVPCHFTYFVLLFPLNAPILCATRFIDDHFCKQYYIFFLLPFYKKRRKTEIQPSLIAFLKQIPRILYLSLWIITFHCHSMEVELKGHFAKKTLSSGRVSIMLYKTYLGVYGMVFCVSLSTICHASLLLSLSCKSLAQSES